MQNLKGVKLPNFKREQEILYEIKDNYVGVIDCNRDSTSAIIQSEIDGKPVTSIQNYIFSDRYFLENIVIPDSVKEFEINIENFKKCYSLKEITIPETFKEQMNQMLSFYACFSTGLFGVDLENITINYTRSGKIVETIEQAGCIACGFRRQTIDDLTYDIYDDHVELKGYNDNKKTIIIPSEIDGKSVTKIDGYAFKNHESLKEINIPDSVEEIGLWAFEGCKSLKKITIPEKFKEQMNTIFYNVDLNNTTINYTRDGKIIETVKSKKNSTIEFGMVSGKQNSAVSSELIEAVGHTNSRMDKPSRRKKR